MGNKPIKKEKSKKISNDSSKNANIVLCEADGVTAVQIYATIDEKENFLSNWGENIQFRPAYIFNPKTKAGVCNIVKWAGRKNLRIRASGYRHTWNNVYADDGQILVSLLGLKHVDSDNSASVDGYLGHLTQALKFSVFNRVSLYFQMGHGRGP
jgi:hypothetical protein